jgi:peptidoglycan/xylan/chitin deacetylase (PgdA/CDA1 family)
VRCSTKALILFILFSLGIAADGSHAADGAAASSATPVLKAPDVKTRNVAQDAPASAPAKQTPAEPAYTPHPPRGAKDAPPSTNDAEEPPSAKLAADDGKPDYSTLEGRRKKYFRAGDSSDNAVALTFDDGPNPHSTVKILNYLRENHVPATFFVVGENVSKYPAIILDMSESGFEIANHTWNHPGNFRDASEQSVRLQLGNSNDEIERITAKKPVLFRPPGGSCGATVIEVCDSLGMQIVFWSIDTNDWRPGMTREKIVEMIGANLKGGSVILMHDIYKNTAECVPEVVELVKSRGFELVTVSELIRRKKAAEESGDASGPAVDGGGA